MKTSYEDFLVIGVDVGGSHITAAQVNLRAKTILEESRKRAAINANGTVQEIIKGWADIIASSFGDLDPLYIKIGIAFPGPCDYENGICLGFH